MSCENGPNKFARMAGQISAGISRLAGKRSFYAGLAVGAGGAAGGLALTRAIRKRRRGGAASEKRRPAPVAPSPDTRTRPKKIPQEALRRPGSRANPRPIPVLTSPPAETKLQAATIRIQTGDGQPFTPQSSYRVVRPDGSETGLAITPFIREDGGGRLMEDTQQWGVTHAASGSLISGPYDSVARAQGLATQLAGLGWTEPRLPAEDIQQARQIISAYHNGGDADQQATGADKE
jgi:hypothetical protein